ncbi:MAG: citrate synthase [Oscillospiraceae bacterium]|jgi:citrate synthase|nr:citrate synthase [Oscillospiraceae bacterium]
MNNGERLSVSSFAKERAEEIKNLVHIDRRMYEKYEVRRGLRNPDGTGVVAGVTYLGNVSGYYLQDGERIPSEGRLTYRGIDIRDLCDGFLSEGRSGYEETSYLLMFGRLPNEKELAEFKAILAEYRELPDNFAEDMILKAPSPSLMNKLARSVLALYAYDDAPETFGGPLENEIEKSLYLTARAPVIVAHSFAAKQHYYNGANLHIRRSLPELDSAENLLALIYGKDKYTPEEATLLDLCMVVSAEHGGGNNSTFACRVLSSSGTDIYSAVSGAIGSLKGPRHGGANERVVEMLSYIENEVSDWTDDDEVRNYLVKILNREAGARDGIIYGIGHAVYTLSDPRAIILREKARDLAQAKGFEKNLDLIERVVRLAPEVLTANGKLNRPYCANFDMYSGFVYRILGLPSDIYTPIFAASRVPGWCAHRIEELWGSGKIMRPAYRAISSKVPYTPLDKR